MCPNQQMNRHRQPSRCGDESWAPRRTCSAMLDVRCAFSPSFFPRQRISFANAKEYIHPILLCTHHIRRISQLDRMTKKVQLGQESSFLNDCADAACIAYILQRTCIEQQEIRALSFGDCSQFIFYAKELCWT